MNEDAITTAQAAAELGVHVVTLRRWRENSEFIGCCATKGSQVFEDCQGLTFYYENTRRVMYYASSVQKLKRILNRRKGR